MSVLPKSGVENLSSALRLMAVTVLRALLILIVAAAAGGCMSVHITQANGQVQTIRQFGVLKVEVSDPQQAVIGSSSGFGVIGSPLGWSVGYTQQRWALMGTGCRAVVWAAPGAVVNAGTRDELAHIAGVCLLDEGNSFSTHTTEVSP